MSDHVYEIRKAVLEYGQNQFDFGADKIDGKEWEETGDRLWGQIETLVQYLDKQAEGKRQG